MKAKSKKVWLLVSFGGMLEFYDFIIYALLASYLAKLFFPSDSLINGILVAFSVYAVGYLVRPLGGIIFGHFGDKYGRKKTFTCSILIMAISTFIIGCLPSYHSIGITASILLVLCRIAQGFSVGGEIPGAISYISEVYPKRVGLMTAIVFCFLISGVAVGFIIEAILLAIFSSDQILAWAWRIPFIIGGCFGLLAYFLRRKLVEINEFDSFVEEEFRSPFLKTICTNIWQLFYGSVIVSFGAFSFVTLFLLLPTYLSSILGLDITNLVWINSLGVILLSVLCMITGFISDKVSREKLLLLSCILVILGSFFIYTIYAEYSDFYILAILLSAIAAAIIWGNVPALLCDRFSQDVKYTSIGVSYNIGFAIFGGLAPLIVTSCIKFSGSNIAPAYVLSVVSIFTIVVIFIDKFLRLRK